MAWMLYSIYGLVIVALLALSAATLGWMLYAWGQDGSLTDDDVVDVRDGIGGDERLSFSLLVPARHEEHVLATTLDHLAAIRHDYFEVIVIVGHDDPGTAEIAFAAADRHPNIQVVVDTHREKNKPRALNTGLARCRGDVVAVFDAEDLVHPDLLEAVERRMLNDGCAALQAGVQLMNFWSSWYSVRNVLEYYFWFRSRLHYQASRRFIPLGGNTVFIRRDLLEFLGGWDGDCLAEDCEIGVRLSSYGYTVSVIYDPRLVTREETPATLGALVRQRTRWNQGFFQVLGKGDWKLLPHRRQRVLAMYTLCTPFVQALTALSLPFSLATMLLFPVPAGLAALSFLPLAVTVLTVAIENLALRDFGKLFGERPTIKDHARLTIGAPAYQTALAFAALRAVIRHGQGRLGWEKTTHVGRHLVGIVGVDG